MKNKLFIVTGSSKGLGKALVEALVKEDGSQVIGVSRSTMDDISGIEHVKLDLGDIQELEKKLDRIFPIDDFDQVVLINNAGWIGEIAPVGKLTPEGIAKLQTVNVVAPAILMNEFVRRYGKQMETKKVIVNISSGAANKNIDGWSGYSSTKAALNRMTAIAQEESELHDYGIQYYALSPGVIDTPMQEEIRSSQKDDFSNVEKFKALKANAELSTPKNTAQKVLHLIRNVQDYKEVFQDVREF
ncbi:SDR family NAD(P)-dependent oxidoreductase [Echinicola jeungdonensis]|uniref:SDR family NAD(P)-dependent oxidoreductase n=1 Tax=Echinicola jeungdonensis TaxID=709343 RepID=A0ABV5J7Y0_9BACT|nr:SDR family NAD(P)-dependent oxidoreductase [Echinicola jeungdonensis]MDN3670003.1 SDR family NAD(P)-dependent oxidoreductase [Echinicola jeungdonensis]